MTPYNDEARAKSTVVTLCALLDLFNLPGEDSVLEWELRRVLYACSEPERQIILDAAKQASAAIGRYLSVRQVASMFATRPRYIRQLARSGELQAVMRDGRMFFAPETIEAYISTHRFMGTGKQARRASS